MSDDNGEAKATMQRWIARLRTIEGVAVKAAPLVADQLRTNIVGNFAAQRGPDGAPWKPAKDGRVMFESAPAKLHVEHKGTVVSAKIRSRNLFRHHAGIARGRAVRPLLPTKNLPQPVTDAIKTVLAERFNAHFKE